MLIFFILNGCEWILTKSNIYDYKRSSDRWIDFSTAVGKNERFFYPLYFPIEFESKARIKQCDVLSSSQFSKFFHFRHSYRRMICGIVRRSHAAGMLTRISRLSPKATSNTAASRSTGCYWFVATSPLRSPSPQLTAGRPKPPQKWNCFQRALLKSDTRHSKWRRSNAVKMRATEAQLSCFYLGIRTYLLNGSGRKVVELKWGRGSWL